MHIRFYGSPSLSRLISPCRADLASLRQPLEEGEWRVLDFFDKHLPLEWEIYVQPHLNGLRPDFVLLHPKVGIAVFEVKNWNLDAMSRYVKVGPDKMPILRGKRDGKDFSLQKDNPVEKVYRYKNEIQNLYCPRLNQKLGFTVITAGIIFPSADDQQVAALLKPCLEHRHMLKWQQYYPLSGRNALMNNNLLRVFPEALKDKSQFMNPELASDLRLWLVEPDEPKTQRTQLELDARQRKLSSERTESGFRRIKGPAGSGKSLVLAARAARLVAEGKDVLVVVFNITLINYLADSAVRNYPNARKLATWLNFHHWCKRVCDEADHDKEYTALWHDYFKDNSDDDSSPNEKLVNLVRTLLNEDTDGAIQRYDAILVDEGQDFLPDWWELLRKVLRPAGEMLFFADATQDVYGTARSWTDETMLGMNMGFHGDWTHLNISYRLPSCLIDHMQEFGRRFLHHENVDLPHERQEELPIELPPCKLRWCQLDTVDANSVANAVPHELDRMLITHEQAGLSMSDVTILVDSQRLGLNIVKLLAERNIQCIHTFTDADSQSNRAKKLAFFMGDGRVKVTTIHSFKGWETRFLLICVGHANNAGTMPLLYTGMTRLKWHQLGSFLTIICSEPSLKDYGVTWPDFSS